MFNFILRYFLVVLTSFVAVFIRLHRRLVLVDRRLVRLVRTGVFLIIVFADFNAIIIITYNLVDAFALVSQ
jgi:hypothetical protein